MAVTVLAAELLHVALPSQVRSLSQAWIYPVIGIGLLLVLVIGDPGRIDNRAAWLRVVTGLLIASITLDNAFAAVHLVKLIITNANLGSAIRLLAAGAVIWLVNAIAFGLWYWDLDRGGAAARAAGTSKRPAFLFPEMTNPEWVEDGWYPSLIDYLHMSFAISAAFSPTDVSAIKHWSKMMMTFQSAVSLLLAVLVVARAINILPTGG
ncbi:MAG TPA: hypothetical protein VIJ82_02395 [Streptosporangiaceae bacterium]|jgi:hypothetical protein